MRASPRWPATIVMLTLIGAACGRASGGVATVPPPAPPGGISDSQIEALYRARMDSARAEFTDTDARFVTGMIGHHAQAVVMSEFAPPSGASPPVRTLAARIINAQRDEIARMQEWLRDRDRPVPEVMIRGSEMMVHGADQGMPMQGMLSDEQMDELEAARGVEFDRLFLTYMIQHHRGGVVMVDELFATDGTARDRELFKLATDIHVDQATEIARMGRMLEKLFGAPASPVR